MKRILFTIIALAAITTTTFGQVPEGIKYQAVIRDGSNMILTNQAVGVRLTIHQGSFDGPEEYMETFSTNSNEYGLVNLEIGTGITTDDFTQIDWRNGPFFIETAIDVSGGTSYSIMGTSQLMSVPFAMHAKTAENVFSGDYNDLSNQPVIPVSTSDMINDSGFISNADDADADPANEIQDLELVGNILTITNNSTPTVIDLSPYLDDTNTQLSESEVDDFVSNNGFITNAEDADSDPVNEIQDLQLVGNILSITNNGTATTVDLSVYLDDTNTQLSESEVDSFVANNGYMDNTDEQTISISNDTLYIENGNGVFLGGSGPVEVITDTDDDTKIQVEENLDEDRIRFDLGGVERWVMEETNFYPRNTNSNINIGYYAGRNITSGHSSLYVGFNSGTNITTGMNNTAVGYRTLANGTTAARNTALGAYALFNNTQTNEVAVGYRSMYNNTTGDGQTAVGYESLFSNTTGYGNNAFGYQSLWANTTGRYNAGFGSYVLQNNLTGEQNVGMGHNALRNNVIGNYNTGVGAGALNDNVVGNNSTALGYQALVFSTSGNQNTGLGSRALRENITGTGNTAVGNSAGDINTVGSNNTFIGNNADATLNNLTNATAIGSNTQVGQSNAVVLGNGADVGIGTSTPEAKLDVVGSVKITDGTEAAGKILTSDANGNATWQTNAGSGMPVLNIASATPATANNFDVTGIGVLFVTPTNSWVNISGLQGGVTGQVVHIINKPDAGTTCCMGVVLQDNNPGGIQKFKKSGSAGLDWEQGATVVFDGTYWRVVNFGF